MCDSKSSVIDYDKTPIEKRKAESARILTKFPDRVPVFVTKDTRSDIPDIDKQKFLVPKDLTIGQFVYVIRKRLTTFPPERALFVFANNSLPPTAALISTIYDKHKSSDGFLRITYAGENTFG